MKTIGLCNAPQLSIPIGQSDALPDCPALAESANIGLAPRASKPCRDWGQILSTMMRKNSSAMSITESKDTF